MEPKLQIEVVYATAAQQNIVYLEMQHGSTVMQAVQESKLYDGAPADLKAGIFGKIRSLDYELRDGDRVEIYQALLIDPKQARKDRAKQEKKRRKDKR